MNVLIVTYLCFFVGPDDGRKMEIFTTNLSLKLTMGCCLVFVCSVMQFDVPSFLFEWQTIFPTLAHIYPLNKEEKKNNLDLSDYMQRLGTFKETSQNIQPKPHVLASQGFYASGNPNKTKCFECGMLYSNWKHGDDPREIHSLYSPKCPFLRKGALNDDCDSTRKTNRERHFVGKARSRSCTLEDEAESGANDLHTTLPSTNDMQNGGMVIDRKKLANRHITHGNAIGTQESPGNVTNVNASDIVEKYDVQHNNSSDGHNDRERLVDQKNVIQDTAANSGIHRNSFLSLHDHTLCQDQYPSSAALISVQHSNESRMNGHSRRLETCNRPVTNQYDLYKDSTRYPSYAVLTARIRSFQGWPSSLSQKPRALATAGFFYVGTLLKYEIDI